MARRLAPITNLADPQPTANACEHRKVSKDGRIVCAKIVEGDNALTPSLCDSCPFSHVNCAHLRFSLTLISPSPLIVRFNGRTEVWDDDPADLRFRQAACEKQLVPISSPSACTACSLRQPIFTSKDLPAPRRRVAHSSKVVPFPASGRGQHADKEKGQFLQMEAGCLQQPGSCKQQPGSCMQEPDSCMQEPGSCLGQTDTRVGQPSPAKVQQTRHGLVSRRKKGSMPSCEPIAAPR